MSDGVERFTHDGLDCKIVKTDMGHWCGYVRPARNRRTRPLEERLRLETQRGLSTPKWRYGAA